MIEMIKATTCCFTGHRKLPEEKIESIIIRLNDEVDRLINQGVTDFMSGGALGFDQIAASLIVSKKELGKPVRLIFALPCKGQEKLWTAEQKRLYHNLLAEADEIIYVSEEYTDGCMEKRNRFMVDHATYCVCAQLHRFSGTSQTVRYAEEKALRVVNVAD